ncbi:MAG: S9 family peptidase [bacterium]
MNTKVRIIGIEFLVINLIAPVFGQSFQRITLQDAIKNRTFSSKVISGIHPMKDGKLYCQLKKDSLNVYDYATGRIQYTIVTSRELISKGDTVPLPISSYELSNDENQILFSKDEESIYRYSSKANYYIYDRKDKTLIPLSEKGKQRLATFSPDATMVAFVRDNNLFIWNPESGIEQQVTFDGKLNEIINGATDWVYEEEFGFTKALFWSPDGKKLAFYRFDETRVKEYELSYYGETYPEIYKFKYPKAGEDNSLIAVYIFDLSTGKSIPVELGIEQEIYIPRIKWTEDPEVLALYGLNRHQNKLDLMLADASTGTSRVILTEENPWYIDITDDWTFLKDRNTVLLTSEQDGFNHIYLYSLDGKLIRQLTSGPWDVTQLIGVDEQNQLVYFQSAELSPLGRDIYSVRLDGTGRKRLSTRTGTNRAQFSADYTYYTGTWSDINTPPLITVNSSDGEVVRVLETNEKLKEKMKEYGFAEVGFFTFTTADNLVLNGWMLKPLDFDSTRKHPVLFTIYGGPGSQTVLNRWGSASAWNQLLAQHEIIIVSVDNRGTGARGEKFKKCTYLELGKFETLDQIEAAKYLGTFPYVDKNRIGMWGWSFGGYLTLSCLTRGADVFRLGVAVAPVTNWKYYDNIYTERFMRTPKENEKGYEDNSPVNHASNLKGKLLMIHGMADDNVHAQNSYDMITALVEADKQFELQIYPNSNHGIYRGSNTTWHLYSRMTDFILKNFEF